MRRPGLRTFGFVASTTVIAFVAVHALSRGDVGGSSALPRYQPTAEGFLHPRAGEMHIRLERLDTGRFRRSMLESPYGCELDGTVTVGRPGWILARLVAAHHASDRWERSTAGVSRDSTAGATDRDTARVVVEALHAVEPGRVARFELRADHVDGEEVAQACVVGGRAATTSTVDRRVIPADLRAPALGNLVSASGRGIDLPAFSDLEAYEVRSDGDELLFCEQVFVRNGASSGDVLSWRWMLTFVPDQDS